MKVNDQRLEGLRETIFRLRRRFFKVPRNVFEDAIGDAIMIWLERKNIPQDIYQRQMLFWTISRGCIAKHVQDWSKSREEVSLLPWQSMRPERIVLLREVLDAIEKSPITNRTRQAIVLSAFGESVKDIALSLNITIANVKKKLYRGRSIIRRFLGFSK